MTKKARIHSGKKTVSPICGTVKTGQLHSKEGFQVGSVIKNLPANAGNVGSVLGSWRSSGGGNCNPLQYSCLGNLMDRGVWLAAVHESQTVRLNLVSKQQQVYKRMKSEHSLIPYIKIKWKLLKALTVRSDTIKFLEGSTGRRHSNINHSEIFFYPQPRVWK